MSTLFTCVSLWDVYISCVTNSDSTFPFIPLGLVELQEAPLLVRLHIVACPRVRAPCDVDLQRDVRMPGVPHIQGHLDETGAGEAVVSVATGHEVGLHDDGGSSVLVRVPRERGQIISHARVGDLRHSWMLVCFQPRRRLPTGG